MYIIGTSGHVDHGKSALIESLSSINPMHLPDEKKRGMTIELGFAYIKDKDFNKPIGIVDVPGHERFIRNMVAGIWALDCVLLVVALDDGIMDMTYTHLSIAKGLGVSKIILVGTKCDLLSEDEAEKKMDKIHKTLPLPENTPYIAVSNTTGRGVEDLKALIIKTLKPIKPLYEPHSALYVDRVFEKKGFGHIVTGSLTQNTLCLQQNDIIIYPQNQKITIKGIQAYHQSETLVEPKSRVSLQVKTSIPIKRGDLITNAPPSAVIFGKFLLIEILEPIKPLKNFMELELALGSTSSLGKIMFLSGSYITIELQEEIASHPHKPLLLIAQGGHTLLSIGRILVGLNSKEDRQKIKMFFPIYKQHGVPIIYTSLIVALNGGFLPLGYSVPEILNPYGIKFKQVFIFSFMIETLYTAIIDLLKMYKGIMTNELSTRSKVPLYIIEPLLEYWETQKKVIKKDNKYYTPSTVFLQETDPENKETPHKNELTPPEKKLIDFAKKKGKEGFSLKEVEELRIHKKILQNLISIGEIIFLDDNLYMLFTEYLMIEQSILDGHAINDIITIQYIKEKKGLSRRYSLPILTTMEKRGYLKRQGSERIITKI